MSAHVRRVTATIALASALLVAASTAAAADPDISFGFFVGCTGPGQLCDRVASYTFETAGDLQLAITSGSVVESMASCSDVRYHVSLNGVEVLVTDFLAPGTTTDFAHIGPVAAGDVLTIRAEGRTGGCNTGTLTSSAGTAIIRLGDLVPTAPTTKDQCKDGGWETFTSLGFKNQGDCVSFVATGGRNEPAG